MTAPGKQKFSFSLGAKKKKPSKRSRSSQPSTAIEKDFGGHELKKVVDENEINSDLPKEDLIIPAQKDSRRSLQEEAQKKRDDGRTQKSSISEEDKAAIAALNAEAANGGAGKAGKGEKDKDMVIKSSENNFQREKENESDKRQLENELENLSSELDVDSEAYHKVPIRDFGAALLRGMGWSGDQSKQKNEKPAVTIARPSRLGLGAIPKMMESDALQTHSKRPRRQDQMNRDRRLKEQQEEYAKKQADQVRLDKQKTLQEGSIVWCSYLNERDGKETSKRAVMKQLQGVPGLNMVLVHVEKEDEPRKVKKGSIQLIERADLEQSLFSHPVVPTRPTSSTDNRKPEVPDKKRRSREEADEADVSREDRKKHRRESSRDDRTPRDKDRPSQERQSHKSDRKSSKEQLSSERSRKHSSETPTNETWLLSNIRVRVITKKFGGSYYKQKGVVVDVSFHGKATLRMENGEVIHASERHVETALPKVGGNAVILAGRDKFSKGKLLQRDSRKCQGSIQIFDDMSIVTQSLDDIAEWCGPLDDDIME